MSDAQNLPSNGLSYKHSGVDIDAGNALVEAIKPAVRSTRRSGADAEIGGFGGVFDLKAAGFRDPVLVAANDGVGTKLRIAIDTNNHAGIGIDLVAMCVNDLVVQGAEPLFFLDYYASAKLQPDQASEVVAGIAEGCREAGCALIGGESAEMPDHYRPGDYDLAGFAVGVVGRRALLGPDRVRVGDELVAVASSGLHSNGFSLARRVLQQERQIDLNAYVPELGKTLGEELLTPTRIYASLIQDLLKEQPHAVHAICHVTGGGLVGNLNRVLQPHQAAHVTLKHTRPPVFELIAQGGPVDENEMRRTFNLGIGLVLCIAEGSGDAVVHQLRAQGESAWMLGNVVRSTEETPAVIVTD